MSKQTVKVRAKLKNSSLRRKTPAHPPSPAIPSPVESGPELLKRLGIDAAAWCAEMVKMRVVKADPEPGGNFHAWMCNAIMNAGDTGYSQKCRELREREALQRGRAMVWADIEDDGLWFQRQYEQGGWFRVHRFEPVSRASQSEAKPRPSILSRLKAWWRR